ncbi:uncharacterized protein [Antedon mediterranea]|uniref:uncharacterized protein n=1 Tax=Antedon mediterranea TaxID=105859 RepID=UPI003AF9D7EB
MRQLPPIYIPTGSSDDNSDVTTDRCLSAPSYAAAQLDHCQTTPEVPPVTALNGTSNNHHIEPSENVVFSLPSSACRFYFDGITLESTVEDIKKRLELELGLPSDAVQLILVCAAGKCQMNGTTNSSRLVDVIGCTTASTHAVNVQIEICQSLLKTFRLACEGNVDEIISSGTLDLLDTPFLKSLPCEDVIRVVLQRSFLMLCLAVNRGHFGVVDTILKKNVDPNTCTPFGRTPLHVAAFCGQIDILEILLSHGANVSLKDMDGNTPQDISASRGHTNCIRRLWLHRWNLRPPILTMCQQKEINSRGSSANRTTLSTSNTRTYNSNMTLGTCLALRAHDVVKLWSMECSDQSRLHSSLGKRKPNYMGRTNSKTLQKSNPANPGSTGGNNGDDRETTYGSTNKLSSDVDDRESSRFGFTSKGHRSPTVSICTVVNFKSPFLVAEISPISKDLVSPADDAESRQCSTKKRERINRNESIDRHVLMRKLVHFHRPPAAVSTEKSRPKTTPPDFQAWLTKKNTNAKKEAIAEHERSEKMIEYKSERKELNERAYKNWLSNKRRLVKPRTSSSI